MAKKAKHTQEEFDYRTINSVEAAFKKCGLDPKTMPDISMLPERFSFLTIVFILSVIFEAVNNGWKPDYSDSNQGKYFPWPWVSSSGLGFSNSYYCCGRTGASVGFPLCTYSRETAIFIFEQFPDIWKAWLLNVKKQ